MWTVKYYKMPNIYNALQKRSNHLLTILELIGLIFDIQIIDFFSGSFFRSYNLASLFKFFNNMEKDWLIYP